MSIDRDKRILEALQRKARESLSEAERTAFGRKAAEVEERLQAAGIQRSTTDELPPDREPPAPPRAPARNDGHRHGKRVPDPVREPSIAEDLFFLALAPVLVLWRLARRLPFMAWLCALVIFSPAIMPIVQANATVFQILMTALLILVAVLVVLSPIPLKKLKRRGLLD